MELPAPRLSGTVSGWTQRLRQRRRRPVVLRRHRNLADARRHDDRALAGALQDQDRPCVPSRLVERRELGTRRHQDRPDTDVRLGAGLCLRNAWGIAGSASLVSPAEHDELTADLLVRSSCAWRPRLACGSSDRRCHRRTDPVAARRLSRRLGTPGLPPQPAFVGILGVFSFKPSCLFGTTTVERV
jgi:hypothetical protein